MDLTKSILDQLSGDNIDKLSSLFGASPKATQSAAEAAVPTILSSLAGLAASDDGAKKLSSTLGGLDQGSLSLANLLTSPAGDAAQKGGGPLGSLLTDNVIASISDAIARYAGLDAATTKKIVGLLLPMILAKVAAAWKAKGGTTSALQGLFADQKSQIADAVPAGLSLADIPGLRNGDAAVRMVDRTASAVNKATRQEDIGRSPASWLLPLAAGLLGALGLWYFFSRDRETPEVARNVANMPTTGAQAVTALKPALPDLPAMPVMPDIAAMTKDVSGAFTSVNQALAGIRDAASAQAALPKLTELGVKIDGIRDQLDKLPAAGQTALGKLVGEQFGPLQEQATRIMTMPDINEEVRSSLGGITSKLAGLNLAGVSRNATDIFSTLTTTLNGFTDTAAAEAALPKLQEVSGRIDDLQRVQAQMSPHGQSMLAKLVSKACVPLNELISKVLAKLGADAAVAKPVLEEIVGKLAGLASVADK